MCLYPQQRVQVQVQGVDGTSSTTEMDIIGGEEQNIQSDEPPKLYVAECPNCQKPLGAKVSMLLFNWAWHVQLQA